MPVYFRLMRFNLTIGGLSGPISDQKLKEIRQQMMEDDEIQGVAEYTFSVWQHNSMGIPYNWINISERIECCQRVGASYILVLTIIRSEWCMKNARDTLELPNLTRVQNKGSGDQTLFMICLNWPHHEITVRSTGVPSWMNHLCQLN